jgi:hypothetical protein
MLIVLSDSKICKKLINAFLIENGKMVNSLNSWKNFLENRKWFWISYSNSNTFYVESFVRFKNMQTKLVNAF